MNRFLLPAFSLSRASLIPVVGLALLLASCSGNSNTSGPAAPLPTGQTGSISALFPSTGGNCYLSDGSACGTTGTNGITALAAGSVSSTNTLLLGDAAGGIAYLQSPSATLPSAPTPCTTGTTSPILALALSSGGGVTFATSAGIYSDGTVPGACTTATAITTGITNAVGLAYNASAGQVVGLTANGQYFILSGTSLVAGPTTLPNLQGSPNPSFTSIASDPSASIVYMTSIGLNNARIYFYYLSGNALTYLGNYTGTELSSPKGLALFPADVAAQNFCTTLPCTFMDVANPGNNTITQYVLSYSGTGTGTGISVNQFNNAYFNCDIIAPQSVAALTATSGGHLNNPAVFVGENGTSIGPCLGLGSVSYGNNVTAYTVQNE